MMLMVGGVLDQVMLGKGLKIIWKMGIGYIKNIIITIKNYLISKIMYILITKDTPFHKKGERLSLEDFKLYYPVATDGFIDDDEFTEKYLKNKPYQYWFKLIMKEQEDKGISAYAFNLAREIEDEISRRTSYLEKRNIELEAKILAYGKKCDFDQIYMEHFDIKKLTRL